jgi:hypothetical protein
MLSRIWDIGHDKPLTVEVQTKMGVLVMAPSTIVSAPIDLDAMRLKPTLGYSSKRWHGAN